jgi:hypothetical protein
MTKEEDFEAEFEIDRDKILAERDEILTKEQVEAYRRHFPQHLDIELDFISLKELKANPSAAIRRASFSKAPVSVLVNNKVKAVVLDYQIWRLMAQVIGEEKERELRAQAWAADQKGLYLSSRPDKKP